MLAFLLGHYADMVELVDTQDLESCEATRAGSIPVIRTKQWILKY